MDSLTDIKKYHHVAADGKDVSGMLVCVVTSVEAGGIVAEVEDSSNTKWDEHCNSAKLRNASHAHYNITDVTGDKEVSELGMPEVRS